MIRKQILLIGLVLTFVFAMIVPVMAQQTATPQPPASTPAPTAVPMTASTDLFATSNFRANVRSGPGRLYTVLGQIRAGDALDITGILANKAWLRVNFNGEEGWISASLFKITGDLTTAPEAEAGPNAVLRATAGQIINTELGTVIVVTRVNGNLRSAASGDADVLAVIPFGTKLTVTGRTATNNWVYVSFNDQKGWVSSGTLIFSQGNLANAPVLDDSGNPVQPAATATKSP